MKKLVLLFTVVFLSIPFLTFAQGCMEASSDEGVNVVGYLQAQYEYQFDADDNENSFTFNRARMGLVGNIPYDFSYYIMYEFSPFQNGPFLLDGFITYSRLAPYASISIGKFKTPFSLEMNTPCQGLHTINRSMVVNALSFPGRDMGLLIGGNYDKFVKYNVAITNEVTNESSRDENANKTITGRVVISPLDFINFGGSYKYGKTDITNDDENRTRLAGELEIEYSDLLIQAEYIRGKGFFETDDIDGGWGGSVSVSSHKVDLERSGYWAQALYMTPWNIQPVIKYESYDADWSKDKIEDIITFGFNYFFNDWTRLQFNYLYKSEKSKSGNYTDYIGTPNEDLGLTYERDNDELLMQLQVKF